MSRKRIEVLNKLNKAYKVLYQTSPSLIGNLNMSQAQGLNINQVNPQAMVDQFKYIDSYISSIRETFIDDTGQRDEISVAAIEEITSAINSFVNTRGNFHLEPIQEIIVRHPYTFFERIGETIRSGIESFFPDNSVAPLPECLAPVERCEESESSGRLFATLYNNIGNNIYANDIHDDMHTAHSLNGHESMII